MIPLPIADSPRLVLLTHIKQTGKMASQGMRHTETSANHTIKKKNFAFQITVNFFHLKRKNFGVASSRASPNVRLCSLLILETTPDRGADSSNLSPTRATATFAISAPSTT